MANNPFTIDILSGQRGINQGLQNLGNAVGGFMQQQEMQQQQQAAQDRRNEFAAGLQSAIGSDSYIQDLTGLMARFPEYADEARKVYGFTNEQTERIARQGYLNAYKNPEQATEILNDTVNQISAAGGNPVMTAEDAMSLQGKSPDEIRRELATGMIMIDPKIGSQLLNQGMTTQERQRQQQINLDREKFEYGKEQNKLDRKAKILDNQLKKAKTEAQTQQVQQKIEENQSKKESLQRQKISDAQSSLAQAQDTVNLINRITNSEGFSSAVGAKGASSFFGLLDKPIAGTDAADTAALLETLDSKNFLNAIQQMRGLGALSDAEGKKVSSAIQNLSRDQTEKQLRENLTQVVEITNRAIEKSKQIIQQEGGELPQQRVEAPQSAIDFLRQNPNLAEQFKAKYGYLPEGI